MKNHELDQLTERAKAIRDALPTLYLTGEGEFIYPPPTGIDRPQGTVSASDVLAMITTARKQAVMLANTLEQVPRRKVGKKADKAPADA